MNVFYNPEGVGDILMVTIKDVDKQNRGYDRIGNIVRIFEQETKETTGYNIFDISHYIKVEEIGPITLTEELVHSIQKILYENDIEEKLQVDFSPKFVVGLVKEKEKHPNADKLSVCKVDIGTKILQIVCGAPNVDAGQKVVVAKVGAIMPSGLHIKDSELRGVASSGMICSARELEIPNAPQEKGILVLNGNYEIGEAFFS